MNTIIRRLKALEAFNRPIGTRLVPTVVGDFGAEYIEYREVPGESFKGISDTDLFAYATWKCNLFKNIAENRDIADYEIRGG